MLAATRVIERAMEIGAVAQETEDGGELLRIRLLLVHRPLQRQLEHVRQVGAALLRRIVQRAQLRLKIMLPMQSNLDIKYTLIRNARI
jgi:hypothetical protein